MGLVYSQFFVTPPKPSTDFTNQTVIVTGSNVGLGLEAARHFARLNAARVILAVRNLKQGNEAKESIETSTGRSSVVEVWNMDLSSFESVKSFAKKANSELDRLDVLLLNASISPHKFQVFENFESGITVNCLSTFLLLFLMLPVMQKTARMSPPPAMPPRISIVVSDVHKFITMPGSKYPEKGVLKHMSKQENTNFNRYFETKLMQILCLRAITPYLTPPKTGVVLNMLNPGLCHSKLNREGIVFLEVLKFLAARSTEVGSRTLLASASSGWESHGAYMSDAVVKPDGDSAGVSPWARSAEGKEMQQRIWGEVREIIEKESPGCTKVLDE